MSIIRKLCNKDNSESKKTGKVSPIAESNLIGVFLFNHSMQKLQSMPAAHAPMNIGIRAFD